MTFLFTCGLRRRGYCTVSNKTALLRDPRLGDVLHLSTPTTKEVKSIWSQLRHSSSGQKLKESLLCLWHGPILASYSLVLSSLQGRYHPISPEEGLQFYHQMTILPAKQAPSRKPGNKPHHLETSSSHLHACGRQYFLTAVCYINKSTLIYHQFINLRIKNYQQLPHRKAPICPAARMLSLQASLQPTPEQLMGPSMLG